MTTPVDPLTLLNPYLGLAQDDVPQPVCCVCYGTGRDPMSDTVAWLSCATCRGTGESAWRPNVARDTAPEPTATR